MLSKAKEELQETKFIHDDFMQHQFSANSFEKILMSLVIGHVDLFFIKVDFILKKHGEILISELHPNRAKMVLLAQLKTKDGEEIHLSSKYHSPEQILDAAKKLD